MPVRLINLLILLLICSRVYGQPDTAASSGIPDNLEEKYGFTEEELRKFVEVAVKIVPMQEASQKRMEKAIEHQDLNIHQFYRIKDYIENNNNTQPPPTITTENIRSYRRADAQIKKIQREHAKVVADTISSSDLGLDKYRTIMKAYHKKDAIQKAVTEILRQKYDVKIGKAGLSKENIRRIQEKVKKERKQTEEEEQGQKKEKQEEGSQE